MWLIALEEIALSAFLVKIPSRKGKFRCCRCYCCHPCRWKETESGDFMETHMWGSPEASKRKLPRAETTPNMMWSITLSAGTPQSLYIPNMCSYIGKQEDDQMIWFLVSWYACVSAGVQTLYWHKWDLYVIFTTTTINKEMYFIYIKYIN